MELLVENVNEVTVVEVKAEFLDANTSREFKSRMATLLGNTKHLLLDLRHVQYIDSSGLAAMLTCLKQLSVAGGDMKVCSLTSPVRALFDLVKMNKIVEVCKTREECLLRFSTMQVE